MTGWTLLAAAPTLSRGAWVAVTASSLAMWLWFQSWIMDVSLAGYPVLCVYLALYAPCFLWLVRTSSRSPLGKRIPWAVLAPIVCVALEWIRGRVVFDGYPWYALGHPLIDCVPVAQVADLGGCAMASFVAACIAGALVDLFAKVTPSNRRRDFGRSSTLGIAFGGFALAASIGYGIARKAETPACTSSGPRILAVQTNLETDNKLGWPRARQESDLVHFGELSLALAQRARDSGEPIDLIVWPETMLPGFGLEPESLAVLTQGGWWPGDRFAAFARSIAQSLGVPFLVGSPAYVGLRAEGDRWGWDQQFNSAYLIDPQGGYQRYDKIFLTPFGETMPYISKWPWLETQLLALGARGMTFDLDSSSEYRRLSLNCSLSREVGPRVELATPICFEDTVAQVVRRLVYDDEGIKRAHAIVNLSNDGWFGSSDGGRAQHALIARWRCIENRVPMVRVANTGISQAFTSTGEQVSGAVVRARSEGGFAVTMPLDSRSTLFGRVGDVGSPLMVITTLVLLGSWGCRCTASGRRVVAPLAMVGMVAGATMSMPACTSSSGGGTVLGGSSWSSRTPKPDPSSTFREVPAEAVATAAPAPVEAESSASVTVAQTTPAATNEEAAIVKSPAELALSILIAASSSEEPLYRAHALEGLQPSPSSLEPAAFRLLADPNPGVRFAAAVTVGRNRFVQCAAAIEPLTLDPNLSVRAAALYALVRLGALVDLSPLAQFTMSDDADVRSNAFFVLGELGNPSAIPLVESAVGRPLIGADRTRARIVDLQAAESMAKMGDFRQYDPIRAALFAPSDQLEIVALACQMVGEVNDRGARGHLIGIWNGKEQLQKPIEIRLIVGTALIRIGEPNLEPVFQLCESAIRDPSPSVRAQAAATLGWAGGSRATALLAPALADPVPIVRLTAAAAFLRAAPPSGATRATG